MRLVCLLHEVAVAGHPAGDSQDTNPVVDSDHQVVDLVELGDAWKQKLACCGAVRLVKTAEVLSSRAVLVV